MTKITIQDVAQRAGVSVATIDRVLNRRPGVRLQTVEKVESAIRELNYQPDRIAARLARGREYRFWFKSLYFREPNGILFEIATDAPGFGADEPMETLGETLSLPPFLEARREQIEAGLKKL